MRSVSHTRWTETPPRARWPIYSERHCPVMNLSRQGRKTPWMVTKADLLALLGVAVMLPLSWLVPSRTWTLFTGLLAPLLTRLALSAKGNLRRIETLAGNRLRGRSYREVQLETFARRMEENLQVFRCYRPGGWHPQIELAGRDRIEQALDETRGVILWINFFVTFALVPKIALHRAGYEVCHLSSPNHGYPDTPIGRRFLSPMRTRIEDRYLDERIQVSPENAVQALRQLQRRLKENRIISVSVTQLGQQPLLTPFLAGRIRIAAGAPTLAQITGAALLPVFPIQTGRNKFSVEVGPRIDVPPAGAEGVRQATGALAAQLEEYVLEYPGQWRGWQGL